jgi:hypothetical protein
MSAQQIHSVRCQPSKAQQPEYVDLQKRDLLGIPKQLKGPHMVDKVADHAETKGASERVRRTAAAPTFCTLNPMAMSNSLSGLIFTKLLLSCGGCTCACTNCACRWTHGLSECD